MAAWMKFVIFLFMPAALADSQALNSTPTLTRWSSVDTARTCPGNRCTVPKGETWILDASMDVETLTVQGTLEWDTQKDGLQIRTCYLLVEPGGKLQVGTALAPMDLQALIYIKKSHIEHPAMGTRFVGSMGNSQFVIHGRPLNRTWTLLASTASQGSSQLALKHDAELMGWRAGDRIGLATTTRRDSTVHRIKKVDGNVIDLETPTLHDHWGGFRQIKGRDFELAAEVVNLERSVVITGDHDDFEATRQGLHTKKNGRGGAMDIRYARVEFCGQRDKIGRYCMHFHQAGSCPECVFQGNAVVESQQVGITIHGTHGAKVDSNVLWDTRAAGIYTEDGNEMNNTISSNVVICSKWQKCKVEWQNKREQYAGIYLVGMTNDLVGNRVAGWYHGFWTPGAKYPRGQGFAYGKVCPQHSPFGLLRRNVVHDCERFGFYLDNQYPRNIKRDADGYVTDMSSCNEFTADGKDNGLVPANLVEDQLDWHNVFVGHYSLGDVSFVRYTSVNNQHAMYWKEGKTFADPEAHHVRDSVIANDPSDRVLGLLNFLGPAGPFTFRMTNVTFLGGGVAPGCGMICAGQACGLNAGGGPCTAQYLLENVDFSQVDLANGRKIKIGVNCADEGFVLPVFLAKDGSLGGFRSLVSRHLDGFAKVSGCTKLGEEWDGAYGCSSPVRRLNIWSADVGDIWITGPGYEAQPTRRRPVHRMNAGRMPFEHMHKGYGTPILLGREYTVTTNNLRRSKAVFELSDPLLAEYFGTAEVATLKVDGESCGLNSSDSRAYVGAKGVESAAVRGCHAWGARPSLPEAPSSTTPPFVQPEDPTTSSPSSSSASCAAHERCRALAGNCCPTASGMFLGCCDRRLHAFLGR
eukprot:TRINITY_DN42567_c0_g1_i1.p1 TRINITY_DN42567_c0_g1~~TRINITY_DN42567_c0_g1_i1.p1  ORF type:complete len:863 (-),score=115.76 TRINITY_DN42567_c0_g1_i1:230-2818(-)